MPIKPSPAVLRASDILDFLGRTPRQPQTLSEIARRTATSKATCHALLLGLVESGLVARHESNRTYGLGPALISLGKAASEGHDVARIALPEMERLSHALLLPVIGAVQAGQRLVVVAATAAPRPFTVTLPTGQSVPFVPPLGAAYVAWSSPADVDSWIDRSPTPVDDATRAQFLDALALIRQLGFSVTLDSAVREELGDAVAILSERPEDDGVRARRDELIKRLGATDYLPVRLDAGTTFRLVQLSAPVFDHNGEVVMIIAIVPAGSEVALSELLAQGNALRATADRITASIGGTAPVAA